jgi:DNA-binding transcriptional MerR regulator
MSGFERPYLSIGEVLELLKHEYPDLSISRIRAFESSGLLELERTASGYRKFYDGDVDYLRSLLAGRPNKGHGSHGRTAPGELDDRDEHRDDAEPPPLGPNGELPGDPERRHPAAFQTLRRQLADRAASTHSTPNHSTPAQALNSGASSSGAHSSGSRSAQGEGPSVTPEPLLPAEPLLSLVSPPAPLVPQVPLMPQGPTTVGDGLQVDAPLLGSRNPLAASPSGLNLSLDELVASSGVTVETVRELESLGLLKGQGVFSTVYYDEDALLTCRLVASFREYGVEPRHLRMYKLAADREASFFEQVVTPQLRRRNPDARDKAIETLGELVRLGEQLRVVALRQVLRNAVDR